MMLRRLLAPALLLVSISACAQPAAPAPATRPAARPAVLLPGYQPLEGEHYVTLATPQPTWAPGSKIEVAEVFSYRCIHCAEFQPQVNAWKKTMPADVRWEYVPGVFGGTWDNFARAYFAAQILGVQEKTHDNVFKGVFVDQKAGNGTVEDIATMYGNWGVDKAKMLATMNSFGVTAKLNRAKQFAMRSGVDGTPTIIVNGKYRVGVSPQHGFEDMLKTTIWLIARERAATKAAKPAAAPAKKG
jgi:protein dithiol oxidoreductase (disulfide-forming)